MTKLIAAATVVAALLSPATAHAATTAQAKRAVAAEVRSELRSSTPHVSCTRLTSTRFTCSWGALVAHGGPSYWETGKARVTFYGATPDVILF